MNASTGTGATALPSSAATDTSQDTGATPLLSLAATDTSKGTCTVTTSVLSLVPTDASQGIGGDITASNFYVSGTCTKVRQADTCSVAGKKRHHHSSIKQPPLAKRVSKKPDYYK